MHVFLTIEYCEAVAYPGILFGGCSTNSEDRENGDLEAAVIWYKKFHFI
jgi:hypothetical protein